MGGRLTRQAAGRSRRYPPGSVKGRTGAMTREAQVPHEPHVIEHLDRYAPGADLLPGDPALARVTKLQRAGLLSAKPIDTLRGPQVRVRLTAAGYAALEAAPRRAAGPPRA